MYKRQVLTIGVRGSYHFNELLNLDNDKIDLYAGLGLGYRNISWNYNGVGLSLIHICGIVAGFAGMAGYYVRQLFVKETPHPEVEAL